MKNPVFLRIFYKGELVEVKQFSLDQIVIGRADTAQVVLLNESVSPLHAVIELRDAGYYISDLGSKSGVYKNEDKILDARLEVGDDIKIGDYKIEFSVGAKKPEDAPKKVESQSVQPPSIGESSASVSSTESTSSLIEKDTAPVHGLIEKDTAPVQGLIEKDTAPVHGLIEKDTMPGNEIVESDTSPHDTAELDDSLTPHGLDLDDEEEEVSRMVMIDEEGSIESSDDVRKNIEELKKSFKPGNGFNVQITVAWQDKVLSTNTYTEKKDIYMGIDPSNDVIVPLLGTSLKKHLLVKMDDEVKIFINPEMSGEVLAGNKSYSFASLTKMNRVYTSPKGPYISLQLNEVVRVGLQGEVISIFIRFNEDTPKAIAGPLLDLTMSELTSVIVAFFIVAVFSLYMFLYAPPPKEEMLVEEPIRKAKVVFNAPKRVKKPKKKVVVTEKVEKKETPKEMKPQAKDPGKAKKVVENKQPVQKKNNKPKITSAVAKGGSKKLSDSQGANMKSKKVDPNDLGLLTVLGKGGLNKKLKKSFAGSGELQGLANKSTGKSGMNEYRTGDNLGSKLKATGSSGKGASLTGISGVQTGGIGSGVEGLGTGSVGQRAKVNFQLGGQEEEFIGKIDKEAVRRVIKANINSFKYCYNKELRTDSSLYGTLTLQWVITEGGAAERFKTIKNTIGNKDIATCVTGRLKALKFPEPPADTEATVVFPFSFSSQSQ